jgi:hypothetical protein
LTASFQALDRALHRQYYHILSPGGIVQTTPVDSQTIDAGFFGIGLPHLHVKTLIIMTNKLLMHYGCKTATGRLMQTSYLLFFAERGLLFTPLQESYSCYGFLVTHSWIKMLWEKLSMFNIFRSRGALSYSECSTALNLPHTIQEFAESQDVIWWDNFVMGMAFSKLLPIQSDYLLYSKFSHATCWISGFITQLLQVTHTL